MSRAGAGDVIPFRTRAEQLAALDTVKRHLDEDGLIAYPTETVYGFGCTLRPRALARLADVKKRGAARPFLLLVADRSSLGGLHWTPGAVALADAFWPGPLTLVLEVSGVELPREVTDHDRTVALRATSHEGVRLLLEHCDGPLTSTSANMPHGDPARDAARAGHVLSVAAVDWPILTLDGGTLPESQSSTIVDCSLEPPRLLRAGAIGASKLSEVIHDIEATQP
jgi:L-threonylcarbamoyladenylate synthase